LLIDSDLLVVYWYTSCNRRRVMARILVYVNKEEEERLKAAGKDPAVWVRGLVKHAISKLKP
jgi:hypothetical protein